MPRLSPRRGIFSRTARADPAALFYHHLRPGAPDQITVEADHDGYRADDPDSVRLAKGSNIATF
jgi:hypothetical protein